MRGRGPGRIEGVRQRKSQPGLVFIQERYGSGPTRRKSSSKEGAHNEHLTLCARSSSSINKKGKSAAKPLWGERGRGKKEGRETPPATLPERGLFRSQEASLLKEPGRAGLVLEREKKKA